MRISTLNPDVRVFIAQKPGKQSVSASLFAFSATFCPLFLSFHSFLCFQLPSISWFTDLLEGVLSYNPPVRKSAFLAFDHFLIEPPPPSLQHCTVLLYKYEYTHFRPFN